MSRESQSAACDSNVGLRAAFTREMNQPSRNWRKRTNAARMSGGRAVATRRSTSRQGSVPPFDRRHQVQREYGVVDSRVFT